MYDYATEAPHSFLWIDWSSTQGHQRFKQILRYVYRTVVDADQPTFLRLRRCRRCRSIAREGRLDKYKIVFTAFDHESAYDELCDETSAALYEMNHAQLLR